MLYHIAPRGPVLGARSQRVAPQQMRFSRAYHDDPTAGHFSFDKAFPSLANDWYWPRMLTDFRKYCQACHVCGARNRPRDLSNTTNLPGQLVNFPALSRPLERVAMDILGPFVEADGYQYVLVITDHFSRFVWTHKLQTSPPARLRTTISRPSRPSRSCPPSSSRIAAPASTRRSHAPSPTPGPSTSAPRPPTTRSATACPSDTTRPSPPCSPSC